MNTDDILLEALADVLNSKHKLRLGQAVYNAARDRYPSPGINFLAGSDVDPFYKSERIRGFLERLSELCGRID